METTKAPKITVEVRVEDDSTNWQPAVLSKVELSQTLPGFELGVDDYNRLVDFVLQTMETVGDRVRAEIAAQSHLADVRKANTPDD